MPTSQSYPLPDLSHIPGVKVIPFGPGIFVPEVPARPATERRAQMMEERRNRVKEMRGRMSATDISIALGVSESCVRKDLYWLDSNGL